MIVYLSFSNARAFMCDPISCMFPQQMSSAWVEVCFRGYMCKELSSGRQNEKSFIMVQCVECYNSNIWSTRGQRNEWQTTGKGLTKEVSFEFWWTKRRKGHFRQQEQCVSKKGQEILLVWSAWDTTGSCGSFFPPSPAPFFFFLSFLKNLI